MFYVLIDKGKVKMNKCAWGDVPLEKQQEWQRAFNIEAEGIIVLGKCPICGQNSLRHYYYLERKEPHEIQGVHFQGRGSSWEWCSNCRVYQHARALVPAEWNGTLSGLDHYNLTPIPDMIEAFYMAQKNI